MTLKTHIVMLLSVCYGLGFAQFKDVQFEHLTIDDGLSNNTVQCILQDRQGFMWFGTSDGLNRYDGHAFKIFRNVPYNSNSLSNNIILCLFQDSLDFIWVGTVEGLNKYDPTVENFTRYLTDSNSPNSISNNHVNTIYLDSHGAIWLGTDHGLNLYHRETDSFKRFFFAGQTDSTSFYWNNNWITAISEDHNGKLLVGTTHDFLRFTPETGETSIIPDYYAPPPREDYWPVLSAILKDRLGKYWITLLLEGVAVFDSETGKSRLYAHDPGDPHSFSADAANSIYEDQSGLIWIGSDDGLNVFDRKSDRFAVYKHHSKDEYSISGNAILSVYGDKQGNIWFGTRNNGINKVSKWKKPFRHYFLESEKTGDLASGEVLDICEDQYGNIWTGSYGGGISRLNRSKDQFTYFKHKPRHYLRSKFNMVYAIHEDRYGWIWSSYIAINCLNPKTDQTKHYRYQPLKPESHADIWTYTIFEDRDGTLWFGTLGAGLESFDREKERFIHYEHDPENPHCIGSNYIYAIFQDKSGYLWTGTDNGLCKMILDEQGKKRFIRYPHDSTNPNSLSGSIVYTIYEDRKNRFWIGTDQGLNLLDRQTMKFSAWSEKDGLPCNEIYVILEDDHGFLWLRTKRGLVKFNPESLSFRTYDERDGLTYCKSIELGFKAFHRSNSGKMYYGGANGFVVFHPDSLRDNPNIPHIALTGFRLFNSPMPIGPDSPLKKSINTSEKIQLRYNQNIISFDFSALDYTSPDKNQYAYQMEGVNPEWVYCGNEHSASFTNLNPGKYTFRVKGSNNDLVWNEMGTSIKIIITPPWWQTAWAYAIYLLLFSAAVVTTWKLQIRRIRIRNELKMKRFETEKLQEIDQLKSRFFANISHEFRTPLTLILGPISRMLTKTRNKAEQYDLQLVIRNARRLQRLINQLLDLSRLEMGRMSLQAQETDLITFLNRIVQSFESQARLKNIRLSFSNSSNSIIAFIDSEKMENIFYNLLSNAFKFTPQGGRIAVMVQNPPVSSLMHTCPAGAARREGGIKGGSGDYIQISVSDTGRGIPADKLDHIFNRFYQVDSSHTREQEGSGIGLALTRELVELHYGKIEVSSTPGKGTAFTIFIPTGKDHLKPEEIAVSPRIPQPEFIEEIIKAIPAEKSLLAESSPVILLVEDNSEMRTYLKECLRENYRLMEAADGEDGLHQALKHMPDLIVSDVMMPRMDGFTFCGKLKSDLRTSHIPVVLLTARADAESKFTGLETGADDYLSKPFDARELKVRVKNLIEQRRRLRERFGSEVTLKPLEMAFNVTDEKFLQRLVEFIENDISNPGIRVETFVRELGISRAQLYRKLQALCGQSVKAFVRTVRLKQSALLLRQSPATIAEVAYRVGFRNPAYFSECFRKQFGLLPTQYKDSNKH